MGRCNAWPGQAGTRLISARMQCSTGSSSTCGTCVLQAMPAFAPCLARNHDAAGRQWVGGCGGGDLGQRPGLTVCAAKRMATKRMMFPTANSPHPSAAYALLPARCRRQRPSGRRLQGKKVGLWVGGGELRWSRFPAFLYIYFSDASPPPSPQLKCCVLGHWCIPLWTGKSGEGPGADHALQGRSLVAFARDRGSGTQWEAGVARLLGLNRGLTDL